MTHRSVGDSGDCIQIQRGMEQEAVPFTHAWPLFSYIQVCTRLLVYGSHALFVLFTAIFTIPIVQAESMFLFLSMSPFVPTEFHFV